MTEARQYTLFDTAIGPCALAFTPRGIDAVGLPDRSRAALAARFNQLADRAAVPLPRELRAIVEAIVAHLRGELQEFAQVRVDLEHASPFERRVYARTRAIPAGETLEYGALAAELGGVGLSRAVGQALGRNPVPLIVPCHRVVRAGGELGGFSATGGAALKRRLLSIEGAFGPQAGFDFG
jgi:methylated-DNA-[protein]-cysteine S-methyltransferase